MSNALPSFSPRHTTLTAADLLEAAYLWIQHRDTERIASAFGRHESVIYNALDVIKEAARVAYCEAAE